MTIEEIDWSFEFAKKSIGYGGSTLFGHLFITLNILFVMIK